MVVQVLVLVDKEGLFLFQRIVFLVMQVRSFQLVLRVIILVEVVLEEAIINKVIMHRVVKVEELVQVKEQLVIMAIHGRVQLEHQHIPHSIKHQVVHSVSPDGLRQVAEVREQMEFILM